MRSCKINHALNSMKYLGLFGSTDSRPLWEGYRESRKCSRDTFLESYITTYTSIRRLKFIFWNCRLEEDEAAEDKTVLIDKVEALTPQPRTTSPKPETL